MCPAVNGTVGFRASPRLYRGKVLLLALAIAVVSLAEALQTGAREEAAAPAGADGIERVVRVQRIVLHRADTVVAPDAAGAAAPEPVLGDTADPSAQPLSAAHTVCDRTVHSLPPAPRAS